ncbi:MULTISPECIES: TetR/AcrR family transcriptional regulator [unclassified Sphingomonas]|uniref:TetR/AcrR family transcriptional regulator n=1 Tax=unclassified Sphingomonas TaxID=196159 RepID=UPI002151DA51|nr:MULTISPECIES: TetR/AcrR family transcriptional regulator [unclassified Sphingomonas]MCR5871072.1 TetR/AcrR family transcriptional regulator [Sphingomonas sp. J344]UUY00610.1 TetR/AcrR family transcriptional regulator [Sphingomonas sp. J315]
MTMVGIRERKRLSTRARIMESACDLFAARGIEAVTVEEIAAAADVGKGTVYNYFSAKEDIAVAFLIEIDRKALDSIALLPADGMSVADALDAAAWCLLERKPPYRAFVRAFMARVFAADHFAYELAEFQAQLDEALGALFARLLARAGARKAVSIDEQVMSFKTMHFGISAIWVLEGPPFAAARTLTRRHMTLLAKGIEQ